MKILKKISINLFIASFLIVPLFTHAQGVVPATPGGSGEGTITIPNPTKAGSDIMSILYAILNNIVMPIAAVAVVLWIIWAGFQYLLAQGNPAKITKANQQLLWSLIGAGVLLGAAGISKVVQNTVNTFLK